MTDIMDPISTPSPAEQGKTPATRSWTKRVLVAGAVALTLLGGGVAITAANAEGWGFGEGRGGGHHHGAMGMFNREDGRAMGRFMVERMLNRVEATDKQKAKITTIMDAAMADLEPLRGLGRDTREDVRKLLSAGTIDRTALETLRAQRLASADQASRRMITALADAAEVLTPAQRAELAEMMAKRGRD